MSSTFDSPTTIYDRLQGNLSSTSSITRFTPGSKARTLLAGFADEISRAQSISDANLMRSTLAGATGVYLDFIGEIFGVTRSRSSKASTESGATIQIAAPSGKTFGELNGGSDISIPTGTIIQSSDGGIRYMLSAITLDANESYAETSGTSLSTGSSSNVENGVLNTLLFTRYAAYPSLKLITRNSSAILNGSDTETDDVFRYRILNAIPAAATGNEASIRLAAMSDPGIADVLILNRYRGIGTVDIVLDTVYGTLSQATLSRAALAIRSKLSAGTSVEIRGPRLVGIQLEVTPTYYNGMSDADGIRTAVYEMLRDIPMGGSFSVGELIKVILSVDAVKSIGKPTAQLDDLILWRDSEVSGRYPTRVTASDVYLLQDERLVLEDTLESAIKVN